MAKRNDKRTDKDNNKGDNKMNPAIIKSAMDMIKSVSNLSKTAIEASDPEKYANSVNELNRGVSDTYAEMRMIISNDKSLSTDEKLKRLDELAEKEAQSKAKCDEAIKGNREHISKIVLEVFAGLLTCGISFAPSIVCKFKKIMGKGNDFQAIETIIIEELPETIE